MNEAALHEFRTDIEKIVKISDDADWDKHPGMKPIWLLAGSILERLKHSPEKQIESLVIEKEDQQAQIESLVIEKEDQQAKRRKRNELEIAEKPVDIEAREKAGEYIVNFGVHKGKRLKDLPIDYVKWIIGFRQKDREFVPLPSSQTSWLRSNQTSCLIAAQQFMIWRCWACGIEDSRFKNGKLCTSCWHRLG